VYNIFTYIYSIRSVLTIIKEFGTCIVCTIYVILNVYTVINCASSSIVFFMDLFIMVFLLWCFYLGVFIMVFLLWCFSMVFLLWCFIMVF